MSKFTPFRSTLIHQIRLYTRYAYTPDTLIHQIRLYTRYAYTPDTLILKVVSGFRERKEKEKHWLDSLKKVTALLNVVLCLLLVPFLITLYSYSLIYVYLYGAKTLIRLYTRFVDASRLLYSDASMENTFRTISYGFIGFKGELKGYTPHIIRWTF